VTEIIAVEDLTSGESTNHFSATDVFHRVGQKKVLSPTGTIPVRASRSLADHGFDVRHLLGISSIDADRRQP
jgi:hypothetical protein